jgi:hypothetical protein
VNVDAKIDLGHEAALTELEEIEAAAIPVTLPN